MTRSKRARLFIEKCGARLAGIVIWPDDPLFEKSPGQLEINKKRSNTQNTCSKFPGRAFSEVAEAPQAATTQTHPAGRPQNRQEHLQS